MVIDRDREGLLDVVLAHDVLVEVVLDLARLGHVADEAGGELGLVLGEDLLADLDALVADIDAGPGDDAPGELGALAAEGAGALLGLVILLLLGHASSAREVGRRVRIPSLPGPT
jgi:hypothetical protein